MWKCPFTTIHSQFFGKERKSAIWADEPPKTFFARQSIKSDNFALLSFRIFIRLSNFNYRLECQIAHNQRQGRGIYWFSYWVTGLSKDTLSPRQWLIHLRPVLVFLSQKIHPPVQWAVWYALPAFSSILPLVDRRPNSGDPAPTPAGQLHLFIR